MNDNLTTPKEHFTALNTQVEALVNKCERLKQENLALQEQQRELVSERAKLLEKNELARTRIEAMIARLKAME